MQVKPLVSIGLITYNQKDYIREALEGCFAQTYSPLEIIVSDDHSTDGTDKIVESIMDEYRRTDGKHTVIFNRNEKNLGIVGNFYKTFELMHGALLVHCGGDDVSYPNRVERIVELWMSCGQRPTVVYHGADRIDEKGRMLTSHPAPWGYREDLAPWHYASKMDLHFMGAFMAYTPDVARKFPPPRIRMGEDFLFGWRSLMLGQPVLTKERLVKYRIGSGLSTGMFGFRRARMGTIRRAREAAGQALDDLDIARQWMTDSDYNMIKELINARMKFYDAWDMCLNGKTIAERINGYKNGGSCLLPFNAPNCICKLLILPKWMSQPIFICFIALVQLRRVLMGKIRFSKSV